MVSPTTRRIWSCSTWTTDPVPTMKGFLGRCLLVLVILGLLGLIMAGSFAGMAAMLGKKRA